MPSYIKEFEAGLAYMRACLKTKLNKTKTATCKLFLSVPIVLIVSKPQFSWRSLSREFSRSFVFLILKFFISISLGFPESHHYLRKQSFKDLFYF